MDQLWSILNGLQVVELVLLFKIKQPGNVSTFIDFFSIMTDMEVVDAEKILNNVAYLPESDPVAPNFQNAGFSTTLMISNAATFLFNFSAHFSLILVLLVIILLSRYF